MKNHFTKKIVEKIRTSILITFFATSVLSTGVAFAQTTPPAGTAAGTQNYTVLSALPGTTNADGTASLSKYLPGLFNLSIGVGAVTAFVMITFYGLEYMLSSVPGVKVSAKAGVLNAIWGLGFVIFAYAILNTLNPALVNGNLNIVSPNIPEATVTGGNAIKTASGINQTGGGVGCLGTCNHTYINSAGTTINYQDCSNCVAATSFGIPIKTTTVNGVSAQINMDIGNKLKAIQSIPGQTPFTITETWPPTVNHHEQGQYNGTSVDLSLFNQSNDNVKIFIANAQSKGLRAVYEVSTPAEAAQVRAATGLSDKQVISVGYITGRHFSIYK